MVLTGACNALTGASDLGVGVGDAGALGDDASPADAGEPADASLGPDSAPFVDADAAADAGPLPQKRVFVTSGTTTADLGGLAGADAKCKAAADAANLGGAWVAFLSVKNQQDARDRPTAAGPWHLVNGELAITKAQLSKNPITHAINRDENDKRVFGGFVWTGSGGNGSFFDDDCAGFTSMAAADHASTGNPTAIDNLWLATRAGDCNEQNRLYCFEQ